MKSQTTDESHPYDTFHGIDRLGADTGTTDFRLVMATSNRGTMGEGVCFCNEYCSSEEGVFVDAKARPALVLPCKDLRGRHSQGM